MSVKRETYIVVQGWMRTDLNLSGNELLLFALIYGFCQREQNQKFTGSLSYVSNWLGISKKWAIKMLQDLADRGLIRKHEEYRNKVKFCEYDVPEFLFFKGGEQSTPNNTIDNTINSTINIPIINGGKKLNFDPYFNNPILDFYKTQYKGIIGNY